MAVFPATLVYGGKIRSITNINICVYSPPTSNGGYMVAFTSTSNVTRNFSSWAAVVDPAVVFQNVHQDQVVLPFPFLLARVLVAVFVR